MSHELHRLTQKIKSEPLLITPSALANVLSYLEDRNTPEVEAAILGGRKREIKELQYNSDTKTGVISVSGPISYLQYQPMCEEEQASYQRIKSEFDAMIETGAKTVVFDFDTPGGQYYGCMETARDIRYLADEHGIRLVGYVDGEACSAGYALLSAMHEKITNPDSFVGSIGVIVHLVNANKARKAVGIEDIYVYAGKSKVPFNEEGGLKKEFLDKLQVRVDKSYEAFVNHVHEMTGLSTEIIRSTEAEVFDAEDALKLGLVDKAMTREEFFTHLADVVDAEQKGKPMAISKQLNTKSQKEDTGEQMTTETQEAIAELKKGMSALESANTELVDQVAGLTEKLTEANSTISQYKAEKEAAAADALKVKKQTRLEKLEAVLPKEEAKSMLEELSTLSDGVFNSVVSRLESKSVEEEASDDFTEKGASGEGSADLQEQKLAAVANLIKEKQSASK